jgi:hypothetical protein
MLKAIVTRGQAQSAFNILAALSQSHSIDFMLRSKMGINMAALQPLIVAMNAERRILERQFAQSPKPADPKEAEAWKPWTPEQVAASEKAMEKAWQKELAEKEEVSVPGLRYADLKAEDERQGIGADIIGYLMFMVTGAPDELREMLEESGKE